MPPHRRCASYRSGVQPRPQPKSANTEFGLQPYAALVRRLMVTTSGIPNTGILLIYQPWKDGRLSYRPVSVSKFLLELDFEKSAVEGVGKRELLLGVGVDVDAALLVEDVGPHRFLNVHSPFAVGIDDRPDDVWPRLNHSLDRHQRKVFTPLRRFLRRCHFHLAANGTILG